MALNLSSASRSRSSAPHPAAESLPEKSSVEAIAFTDLESYEVQVIAAAWQMGRGNDLIPPREVLHPRVLGRGAANTSLIRVLSQGDDYEFRVIGDAHVQAYGTNYQGKRISDLMSAAPRFGRQLKACCDMVRTSARAFAFRGIIGRDVPDARFVWFETAYFPFGSPDGIVDHVLNAAVYRPRAGVWPA